MAQFNNSTLMGMLKGDSVHIRYSANSDGADFTETWSAGQKYIGIATGQSAPVDKSGYTWCRFVGTSTSDGGTSEDVLERLEDLEKQMSDLNYVAITASLTVSPSTAEVGQSITNAKLTWSVSKETRSITLDGVAVDGKTSLVDQKAYTANKTWTLKATEADEKGATVTRTATLTFYHRIYWGIGSVATGFDSDFVRALAGSKLSNSRATSFTIAPNSQYAYYVVPKSMCDTEPTFIIDKGFAGGFAYKEEVTVTNAYGKSIVYYVYRSDQLLVGSTVIDIT